MTKDEELKPCPFCNGEPEKFYIGNDHTRNRTVKIKCEKCGTSQSTSVRVLSFEKCEKWATEKWNKRSSK